jgi:16S rRNA processing protein RimM
MNTKDHTPEPPRYLDVGLVVRPHGVRGMLLVEGTSDLIRAINFGDRVFFDQGASSFKLNSISAHRKRFLVKLDSIDTREDAERMRGLILQIHFEDADPLPEGSYYYWQLIGLNVVDEDDRSLGELVEIVETGANDVYVVRSVDGKEILIPAIEQVIKSVNLQLGRMEVHLLPGLVD